MKTKLVLKAAAALAVFFMILGRPVHSLAQETKMGKGFVAKKADSQLVLKEYNEIEKTSVETAYLITGNTTFKNFQSLDEIQEYDILEIEYSESRGQRMALTIVKKVPVQELFDQLEYDPNMMQDIQEISDDFRA